MILDLVLDEYQKETPLTCSSSPWAGESSRHSMSHMSTTDISDWPTPAANVFFFLVRLIDRLSRALTNSFDDDDIISSCLAKNDRLVDASGHTSKESTRGRLPDEGLRVSRQLLHASQVTKHGAWNKLEVHRSQACNKGLSRFSRIGEERGAKQITKRS